RLVAQALQIVREASYRHSGVTVLNAAGWTSSRLGRPKVAAEHHRDALAMSRAAGYRYYEVDALLGIAEAERGTGDLDGAEASAREALAHAEDAGFLVMIDRARALLVEIRKSADDGK